MLLEKNILILTSWYPKADDDYSGIFIKHQAIAISKQHEIEIISIQNNRSKFKFLPGWDISQTNFDGFPVYHISVPFSLPIYNQANYLYSTFLAIINTIKHKPRLIHAHVTYPAGVIAQHLSRYWKIPYIITEHRGPIETLFRSKVHKFLAIRALNHARMVIAVSNVYRDDILDYFSTPVEVVPNIIDDKSFCLSTKNEGPFTFGFLGGLNTNIKNLGLLLAAFQKLNDQESYLCIGGAGRLLDSFRKQAIELGISNRCNFLGKINPSKISTFYNRLNAFIISSNYESFNVSGIEALACGLPVIATRCGGPEDYVQKTNGLLIPKNDVEALVLAMKKLRNNYSTFDRVNIRLDVLNKFGVDPFMNKINKIYNQVIKD